MNCSLARICRLTLVTPLLLIGLLLFEQPSARAQPDPTRNFDAATQALMANAERVVFLVPFSHWDTDWHNTYDVYSRLADGNIRKAIQLAKEDARFRFSLEQVLFVQHFWETHPTWRDDLRDAVRRRQITFAWAGITQPDTSLVAPATQVHNFRLGREWIAATFGEEYVPRTAWQSDAFGNAATFPAYLSEMGVKYLYVGRGRRRCPPDDANCRPLPPAFYWTGAPGAPNGDSRILTVFTPYENAWGDIYRRTDPVEQLGRLRTSIEAEFAKTPSKALLLPTGFDFFDPRENLLALMDQWNAADTRTVLVMADAESAFEYLATQPVPEMTVDLNPIWQAFYSTRPYAKVADKETEFYLTATNKAAALLGNPPSAYWTTAAINAHYDNIAGVGYDWVWDKTQRPRYDRVLAEAKEEMAGTLGPLVAGVPTPVIIFNPTSWERSEVIVIAAQGIAADEALLRSLPGPIQHFGANAVAFYAAAVPSLGYQGIDGGQASISNPARVQRDGDKVTLTNGLVSVTLDGTRGGAFNSLSVVNAEGTSQELLNGVGDDLIYFKDDGDVYGAFFGAVEAQQSTTMAAFEVVAEGPLLARVKVNFSLGGKEVIKLVTIRANNPLVAVTVELQTLPNTTALVQTETRLNTTERTDDLGFGAFTHTIDPRPVAPSDITYRRQIFYPVTYWSDVSHEGLGLSIITHGLQGMAGGAVRSFMLVREVTTDAEGVTDPGTHRLRYAYLPHTGDAVSARTWERAYDFNQPLIVGWRSGEWMAIQLPFDGASPRWRPVGEVSQTLPLTHSLLTAENAVVADVYAQDGAMQAIVINYQRTVPAHLQLGGRRVALPSRVLALVPLGE
jgi:hypothetical protein